MEFLGCTDELIAMLPLDEQSCEDQIFFFFIYFFIQLSHYRICRNVIYNSDSNKEVDMEKKRKKKEKKQQLSNDRVITNTLNLQKMAGGQDIVMVVYMVVCLCTQTDDAPDMRVMLHKWLPAAIQWFTKQYCWPTSYVLQLAAK